ncbi:MAG: polysaccharide deacetylase family protein [Bacteroidales bacterium]
MRIYSRIRSCLSDKNKGTLTRFLIEAGLKPKVNRKVNSPFKKGIIIFSADLEMAWAFRYSKTRKNETVKKGLEERENIPVLLDLFQKYNIPVTWATVGHLFLSDCSKGPDGLAHSALPRPGYFENRNWNFSFGDWYQHDPCTNVFNDPAWYASDLIEKIISSDVKHEIGCHTFSHTDFTYKNCPKSLADAELDECIKHAENLNISLRSMVFPGGTSGNYESLVERGFASYRKPMKNHIDLPSIDKYGLVVIPSSIGLDRDRYGWTREFHLKMIRSYIEEAAKRRLVCHFWFHPSMDRWYLENVMPEVLKMVDDYVESSKIEVKTMGELAEGYKDLTAVKRK